MDTHVHSEPDCSRHKATDAPELIEAAPSPSARFFPGFAIDPNVGLGSYIGERIRDVRFTPKSGHAQRLGRQGDL
jgi:hypothetical protein